MSNLTLTSYRKKNINAYLVYMKGAFPDDKYMYGTPISDEDRQKAYKGQSHEIQINIEKLTGWYKYKEASGHKTREGYLSILNGQIIKECDSRREYLLYRASEICENLPILEGSEKQIHWAEEIRAEMVVQLSYNCVDDWSEEGTVFKVLSNPNFLRSSFWIENNKLNWQDFMDRFVS